MKNRNYGIESLRLLLIYMVCLLHVFGNGGLMPRIIEDTSAYRAYWLIEVFSFCAVDAFAIISGYTATDKKNRVSKIINLWFQAFFYSFILTIVLLAVGTDFDLGIKDIIKCALPVTFNVFWYFTAYFILFFTIPILNKYLFPLSKEEAKKTFIVTIFIFSFLGIISDAFVTGAGYSPIWLIVLYCLGLLAKKIELLKSKSTPVLLLIWSLCILITWGSRVFLGTNKLINYISPTILITAIVIVIMFSRFSFKGNVISKFSPLAFGIYLFQLNPVIWDYYIHDRFVFILSQPTALGCVMILSCGAGIFLLGLIVESIRNLLFKLLHIDALSEKVMTTINSVITGLYFLLK